MTESGWRRNIMLTIAYDGTAYCGWQTQANGLAIQECIERGVEKLTGVRSVVLCAGRTDSGVHALGQVASLRTNSQIPVDQFRRGLQSFLPEDILLVAARDVPMKFHATWSAVEKSYRYVLFDGVMCPPFLRHLVHRTRQPLDVEKMQAAAQSLLGRHDFRCFETHYPNKLTSVRTVRKVSLQRMNIWSPWHSSHEWLSGSQHISELRPADTETTPWIVFDITADGFLYNMVRAIVGTLIRIGNGQRPVEDLMQVIQSLDRKEAGMTAPACGLYLVSVEYPPALLDMATETSQDDTANSERSE